MHKSANMDIAEFYPVDIIGQTVNELTAMQPNLGWSVVLGLAAL